MSVLWWWRGKQSGCGRQGREKLNNNNNYMDKEDKEKMSRLNNYIYIFFIYDENSNLNSNTRIF
jgi:hypothetical protein